MDETYKIQEEVKNAVVKAVKDVISEELAKLRTATPKEDRNTNEEEEGVHQTDTVKEFNRWLADRNQRLAKEQKDLEELRKMFM